MSTQLTFLEGAGPGKATPTEWPTVAARIPRALRDRLEAEAHRRSVDLSVVIRDALAAYMSLDPRAYASAPNPLTASGPGSARASDPQTSKAAALDVAPRIGSQRRRALEVILAAGDERGATTDEVIRELEEQAYRQHHVNGVAVNGVARRVTDLYQAGAIEQVINDHHHPVVRPTRHGKEAIVWRITRLGRRWLEEVKA